MQTRDDINQMAVQWFPGITDVGQIHYDTTEFFKVEYGDVIVLEDKVYLVRHNAKEGRFGLKAQDCTVWVVA